jgi:hypothetical protein
MVSAKPLLAALAAVGCLPGAGPVVAGEIEGVRFADERRIDEHALELNCMALLRYKYVFRAYVAALYIGTGIPPEQVLDDVPKRLELSYFWNIRGRDFGVAADQILAQNVDSATLAGLRPRVQRIHALYEDVKPGDRYSLTYLPGHGTELALNDEKKGIIEGADFAAAYFRIWLGERPIDRAFRDQLLDCPASALDRRAAHSKVQQ